MKNTNRLRIFSHGCGINHQDLARYFFNEGKLEKEDLLLILAQSQNILESEPNLLELADPITILGDIHGQYYDMMKILELSGDITKTKYLLLGDYVDRGCFSLEVLTYLLYLKIVYPNRIYLLRGNHESKAMTSIYNFRKECIYKYDLEIYQEFLSVFNSLPLAAIISNSIFLSHAGISNESECLLNINKINRFTEPPRKGIFCDLL